MIATQGPMKNTVESFWRLVMQENVSLVITLAEKIGKDCAVYFPMQKSLEDRYGKCHVQIIGISQTKFVDTRKLLVTDTSNGKKHELTHVHFKGWPDWETPAGDSLEEYI